MKNLGTLAATALLVTLALPGSAPAAEPTLYDSTVTFFGGGKHPKTSLTGLVIDGSVRGTVFVCYDYFLITNDRIKGQLSAVAERISGSRVDKIATFRSTSVEAFDPTSVPAGGDDRCGPSAPADFNFGLASDCVESNAPLEPGDIVRWTFKFKKSSKLKGADAGILISGSVLPFSALAGNRAKAGRAVDWLLAQRESRLAGASNR